MAAAWTETKIMEVLDWAYEKAVNGVAGLDSASELAESYMHDGRTPYEQATSLVRWQTSKAATSGFITGLGGLLTLPVAVPANLASVLYVQIRMIAAIAHIGGFDVRNDKVKTLVFACLVATSATDIAKDVGIAVGNKVAMNALKGLSGKTIAAINKKVGFRLLTKFGEKGAVNLVRLVPIAGGLIGGTVDAVGTTTVGKVAKDTFTPL